MGKKTWLLKAVWYIILLLEDLVKASKSDNSLPKTLEIERPEKPPANG